MVDPVPTADERRSFVADANWDHSYRYFPGELTTEVIKGDQPDWEPPPPAKADLWRPSSKLGE
jgi:hypothetical protein